MTRGERLTPFLAFPPELRRVIYTTNSIESLNYQQRKITQEPRPLPQRSRGHQATLASDLRHRRQTSPRPGDRARSPRRATQNTRTPHRGPDHDELETSTATALTGLPRPHQPPPLTTITTNAYTKYLTLILETAAEGMTRNLTDGPAQVSVFALICLPLGGARASAGRAGPHRSVIPGPVPRQRLVCHARPTSGPHTSNPDSPPPT